MKSFFIFLLVAIGTFIIDYNIKTLFVEGYYRAGECIDLVLHYNKGVAFSMFSFVGEYLKWIQSMLVLGVLFYVIKEGYLRRYAFPVGLLIGGAIGNVYDRFVYDGVVDYIAWHCGFEFAVFNYADIAIDVAVAWLLIENYFFSSKREIG